MNAELDIDTEALADEIVRYLAAVDAFRAANCEPQWRPELPSLVSDDAVLGTSSAEVERSAH